MRIDVVTIFPDYLAPLRMSLLGRAGERGLVDLHVHDLRTWTSDVHRTVDDAPYGGGPGMVMRPEPWGAALDAVLAAGGPGLRPVPAAGAGDVPPVVESVPDRLRTPRPARPRLVVPTPSGRRFDQVLATELAAEPWLVFACGRYEGIDARVVQESATRMPVDEVSIGDYVLAGGEVAVLVMVEALTRLLPGVVGNTASVADDSFAPGPMSGLLEGPVYTRPLVWRGREVPAVLRSGDHAAVARWRRGQAVRRTAQQRPDLFAALPPDLQAAVAPEMPEPQG